MKHHSAIRIEGHVSAGFDAVRDAFAENFSVRHELGGVPWDRISDVDKDYVDNLRVDDSNLRVHGDAPKAPRDARINLNGTYNSRI
jgi:hypothetical protein